MAITNTQAVKASLKGRYRSERRFRMVGLGAIIVGMLFVFLLFYNIISKGYSAFTQTYLQLPVEFTSEAIDPLGERNPEVIARADYAGLIKTALRERFPDVSKRRDKKDLYRLVSSGATYELQDMVVDDHALIGQSQSLWLLADDEIDMYMKGYATPSERMTPDVEATISSEGNKITLTATGDVFEELMSAARRAAEERLEQARREGEMLEARLADAQNGLALQKQRHADALSREDAAAIEEFAGFVAEMQAEVDTLAAQQAQQQSDFEALQQQVATVGSVLKQPRDAASLLVIINGGVVKVERLSASQLEGQVLVPLQNFDAVEPGDWTMLVLETPEGERRIKDKTIAWVEALDADGAVKRRFNSVFFTSGDSREPEQSGIAGALMGSLFTLLVTLALSFPIGVAAAIYLEEFAPKNKWSDLIEVNINNLAAVPSIVFGLLGLAVFINFFGMPRSAPVVGGVVLTLMTLPTIIIASRAALKSVPPSIREAALGMGASRMQTVFHHVLPLAMPGMLTGSIIGMAQALGETAPLLMIGMVAFIVDIPATAFDPSTVLPVQIYLWADSPERAFVERTSAAIMVLLAFLIIMNALAVMLRKKFERRW